MLHIIGEILGAVFGGADNPSDTVQQHVANIAEHGRSIWGTSMDHDIQGNGPKDIWGNSTKSNIYGTHTDFWGNQKD